MSDLPEKIQTTIDGLRQVQQEMQLLAPCPRLAAIDRASLHEFRVVIDYVRQLLWNFIQLDDADSGENVEDEIRSRRLQRVNEMLHTIEQEVKVRRLAPSPATVTFLNSVQEIADAALERHLSSGAEVEKAS